MLLGALYFRHSIVSAARTAAYQRAEQGCGGRPSHPLRSLVRLQVTDQYSYCGRLLPGDSITSTGNHVGSRATGKLRGVPPDSAARVPLTSSVPAVPRADRRLAAPAICEAAVAVKVSAHLGAQWR